MRPAKERASLSQVLALLLILCLYLFSRGPFYTQPLLGEEGIFADMMARSPAGPAYGLMARVQGKEVYAPLLHPALMYAVYEDWGACLQRFAGWMGLGGQPDDLWARMAQSAFQAALWALLAWRFSRSRGRSLVLLVLLALWGLSSPLGVSASIYLQTDTSSGLLLAGALVFSLLESSSLWWTLAVLFAMGAIGKQEWSVAAAAGLVAGEAAGVLQGQPRQELWRRLGWLGAALCLGNLFSWRFDPVNYLGGLHVLGSISPSHQALSAGQSMAWESLWQQRWPFVLPLLGLMLISAVLAWRAPLRRRADELAACAVAWAFLLPFLASTWNGSPRYFAPAWAAALVCAASQAARWRPSGRALAGLLLAGSVLVVWQVGFLARLWQQGLSLTEDTFAPVSQVQQYEAQRASVAAGCIAGLSSAYAWDRPLDFVGEAIGLSDAETMIGPGNKLCR